MNMEWMGDNVGWCGTLSHNHNSLPPITHIETSPISCRREQIISHIPWLQVRFVTKFQVTKTCIFVIPPFTSWLALVTQGKGMGAAIPEMLPLIRLMVYGRVKLQWKLHITTNRTDRKRLDKHFYTFAVNVNLSAIILRHYNINSHS